MGSRGTSRTRGLHAAPSTRSGYFRPLRVLAAVLILVVVVTAVTAWPSSSPGRKPLVKSTTPRHLADTSSDQKTSSTATTTTTAIDPVFDRVLVVGDSLGEDLGFQLHDHLEADNTATTLAAMGDTGLSNTSFYDWPAHLETLLATDHPTLVVVLLGANDDQGLYAGGSAVAPGAAGWDQAYGQRVHAMLTEATAAGADVAWVGMPPMSDSILNNWMQHINGIFQRQTAKFPRSVYVSSAAVLGGPGGVFQRSDATGTLLRTPDGVHLTSDGASELAVAVIAAVEHHDPALPGRLPSA